MIFYVYNLLSIELYNFYNNVILFIEEDKRTLSKICLKIELVSSYEFNLVLHLSIFINFK